MLRLRCLCGSMPERCDQPEVKPSVAATDPPRRREWQDVPDLSPTQITSWWCNTWNSWTDYFIASRRMGLRILAAMIHAGAAAVGSTRDATTKQIRTTSLAP